MSEYKGEIGTIYVEVVDGGERREVWFEDFCILGAGSSEIEALQAAAEYVADLASLVAGAIKIVSPALTEEESQLVIGAIPLQALPDESDAHVAAGGSYDYEGRDPMCSAGES